LDENVHTLPLLLLATTGTSGWTSYRSCCRIGTQEYSLFYGYQCQLETRNTMLDNGMLRRRLGFQYRRGIVPASKIVTPSLACIRTNTGCIGYMSTARTHILPFDPNSTAATIDNIANIASLQTLHDYLPHSSRLSTGEFFGKFRVKIPPFKNLHTLKAEIKTTLDSHFISLDEAHITIGTRDINVGWLYQAIPRFTDLPTARDELAHLMAIHPDNIALVTHTIKLATVTAPVISIIGVKEQEHTITTALVRTFNNQHIKSSKELSHVKFIPRQLKIETQTAYARNHNTVHQQHQLRLCRKPTQH
jgi:hypothetical protein